MDNKQLHDTIAQRMGRDNADVAKLVEAFVAFVKESCGDMNSIAIPGFGTFETKKKLERIVVNPSTGKRMLVPPKISLNFKASALLKARIK